MKLPRPLLALLACLAISSQAPAGLIVKQPDCADLLANLAHCNVQTPDAARIACQDQVCTSYNSCLAGPKPMASIPTLSKLCHGLETSISASSPTPSPARAAILN